MHICNVIITHQPSKVTNSKHIAENSISSELFLKCLVSEIIYANVLQSHMCIQNADKIKYVNKIFPPQGKKPSNVHTAQYLTTYDYGNEICHSTEIIEMN